MKKLSIVIIGLFIFSLPFDNAFAITGACSGHGGVDCSVGPGPTGNVICNDGWPDSSVSYSSMEECQTTSHGACPVDQMNAIEQKYSTADDANQIVNLNNQITTIKSNDSQSSAPHVVISLLGAKMIFLTADDASQINTLQSQITVLQNDISSKLAAITPAINVCAEQNAMDQEYVQMQQERQSFAQTVCSGMNGQLDSNGHCSCASGYDYDPSLKRCITVDQSCEIQYGLNVYGANGNCLCNAGYKWNQSGTACILTPSTSLPSAIIEPATPAPAVSSKTTASFKINSNLQVGASGPDVATLQKFLESKGFLILPAGTTEGYFGLLTKQALVSFQQSAGLPTTGYCGSMTRQTINNTQ